MARLKSARCSTGHGTGVTPLVDLRKQLERGISPGRVNLGTLAGRVAIAWRRPRRRLLAMLFGKKVRSAGQAAKLAEVIRQNRKDLPAWPSPRSFIRRGGTSIEYKASILDEILAARSAKKASKICGEAIALGKGSSGTRRKWQRAVERMRAAEAQAA